MVHAAHEISVLLHQCVERTVGHGDGNPRHARLVSLPDEEVDHVLDRRDARTVCSRGPRWAQLLSDATPVSARDVREDAFDTAAARDDPFDRPSEELGSDGVTALGYAHADLSRSTAVPLRGSTRAGATPLRRSEVLDVEQARPRQLVELERRDGPSCTSGSATTGSPRP